MNISQHQYIFFLAQEYPQLNYQVLVAFEIPSLSQVLLLLLSCFSRVRLCVTPQMAAHQAPLSLGFSRQEYWSGLPFSSPLSQVSFQKFLDTLGYFSVISFFPEKTIFMLLSFLIYRMLVVDEIIQKAPFSTNGLWIYSLMIKWHKELISEFSLQLNFSVVVIKEVS